MKMFIHGTTLLLACYLVEAFPGGRLTTTSRSAPLVDKRQEKGVGVVGFCENSAFDNPAFPTFCVVNLPNGHTDSVAVSLSYHRLGVFHSNRFTL
jgi:hypothetical protein